MMMCLSILFFVAVLFAREREREREKVLFNAGSARVCGHKGG